MKNDEQQHGGTPGGSLAERVEAGDVASFRSLSKDNRKAIGAIIEGRVRIKLAQDQLREDAKAVAERLGMKPAELNKIVRLAMRERERGNVLSVEKALIEVAEQVVF